MATEKAKEQNTKLFVAGEDFEYKGYVDKHSTYIEEFNFLDFNMKSLKLGLWGQTSNRQRGLWHWHRFLVYLRRALF